MKYHILTNVQQGESFQLQKHIDNRNGNKTIGIKSIKYTKSIGYYLKIRKDVDEDIIINSELTRYKGQFNFLDFKEIFKNYGISLTISEESGIVLLYLPKGVTIKYSKKIADILGIENSEDMKISKDYIRAFSGEKSSIFGIFQDIFICLEQLNTDKNFINGAPSKILEILPATNKSYAVPIFARFENPTFKKLQNGIITELTLCLRDEDNEVLKNEEQKITIELCIK